MDKWERNYRRVLDEKLEHKNYKIDRYKDNYIDRSTYIDHLVGIRAFQRRLRGKK